MDVFFLKRGGKRTGRFVALLMVAAAASVWGNAERSPLWAQQPGTHYISDGTVVGSLAKGYRLSGRERDYAQPVQFLLPKGAKIAIAGEGIFQENDTNAGLFGLQLGQVYRLKITEIPFHAGAELFPTVETLNRLYPPAGRELDFPVRVELLQEDLELALDGNLVTRVVYLETPFAALPVDSTIPAGGVTADCPLGTNPVAAAETRGKIMAILRIGSRLPEDAPNRENPFWFGLPSFTLPAESR